MEQCGLIFDLFWVWFAIVGQYFLSPSYIEGYALVQGGIVDFGEKLLGVEVTNLRKAED